jgi:hypothetical protein
MAAKKKTVKQAKAAPTKITKIFVVFENDSCTKILACSHDIEKLRKKFSGTLTPIMVKAFRMAPGRAVKL